MRQELLNDVLARLDEFAFKPATPDGWLRSGKCPHCGKKELYTRADAPWVLRCGRLAKCGWEGHVKEMYSDLFQDWSKRAAPQAKTDPNAAANLYMQLGRGFELETVRGWYTQESYYDAKADNGRGAGSATVRFKVGSTHWERLIDRPARFGKKKAVFGFGGTYQGQWWAPPPLELPTVRELWVVEGIFNAIALHHHGIAAVAAMSCNNYPGEALAQLRKLHMAGGLGVKLVWALDSDAAGRGYTLKWVARAREEGWECEAAQVPQTGKRKTDWNDAHQLGKLGELGKVDEKWLDECRYQGALLIAASAAEKALLIWRHENGRRHEFAFDFQNQLYWFALKLEAFQKAMEHLDGADELSKEEKRDEALKQSHSVRRIANCLPLPLYFQANTVTDESWYFCKVIFPHDGAAVKNTFTAAAFSSASEFKKRLLAIAPGGMFTGTSSMLDRFIEDRLFQIQRVETIDYVGYAKEHAAWVFNTVAVRHGEVVEINSEDFFEFGKLSLKTLSRTGAEAINPDLDDYREDWLRLLWRCFGAKGLVTLTFWFGTLFAEQIRQSQKSWPFLEVVGEFGAGKSTLIEFLWKLVGRADYEGFDPTKATLSARARNFSQVSNLPVVLIESDRGGEGSAKDAPHVRTFDWDELKTAYNGRSVRARGMATGGNETYEPPFRGAIVISQNAQVQASGAILSRICHLTLTREGHNEKGREAALALEQMPVEQVSGFILKAITREAEVMEVINTRAPVHEAELLKQDGIKTTRIAKNHGQLAACAEALAKVLPLTEDMAEALRDEIYAMALERQRAINLDHPAVSEFWDAFEYLDEGNFPLNHSRKPDENIAINLNHFVQGCKERGQAAPAISDLKKLLPSSKRYEYLGQRMVNSRLKAENGSNASASLWCWCFKRKEPRKEAR